MQEYPCFHGDFGYRGRGAPPPVDPLGAGGRLLARPKSPDQPGRIHPLPRQPMEYPGAAGGQSPWYWNPLCAHDRGDAQAQNQGFLRH